MTRMWIAGTALVAIGCATASSSASTRSEQDSIPVPRIPETRSIPVVERSPEERVTWMWVSVATNVRAGPSTDTGVLSTLRAGDSVAVGTSAGGWTPVTISRQGPSLAGYIASRLLSLTRPSSVPVARRNTRAPAVAKRAPTPECTYSKLFCDAYEAQYGTCLVFRDELLRDSRGDVGAAAAREARAFSVKMARAGAESGCIDGLLGRRPRYRLD